MSKPDFINMYSYNWASSGLCVMSIQKITQFEKYLKFKKSIRWIKSGDIYGPHKVVLQKLGLLRYDPASFG
jgi:hypothetical protein